MWKLIDTFQKKPRKTSDTRDKQRHDYLVIAPRRSQERDDLAVRVVERTPNFRRVMIQCQG